MGVGVFDGEVVVEGPEALITTHVYPLKLRLETLDGEPLEEGVATLKIGGAVVTSFVKAGEADLGYLPRGTYPLTINLSDEEVYSDNIMVGGVDSELVVRAGRPSVKVVDQNGKPLQAEVEIAGLAKSPVGPDGVVRFRQAPLRDYPYRVIYMGVEVVSGVLKPGQQADIVVRTATLTVRVFNELGSPLDAEIALSRAGRLLGRTLGPTTAFRDIPVGAYSLTVTYGPKQVSRQLNINGDDEVSVTVPVALSIGTIHLSLQELTIPVMLVVGAIVVAATLKLLPRVMRRG
jgi:hypothetical protein